VIFISTANFESDLNFLMSCQRGDVQAFARLYERYAPVVMRYAWSRLRDRSQAEEVLQDTFLTAWSKIGTSRIIDQSLLPWILTICTNHLRNQTRRNQKIHAVALTEVDSYASESVGTSAIDDALAQLSSLDRRICELCLIDGLSYQEAADRIQSTPASIRNRLHRARAVLRAALTND
jgi:RNA polymerase sigma factor (sigma-70 family)